MQYTGYSLTQDASIESIVSGLTGATGTEGVIISNHSDFTTKNTTYTTKNTSQDGTLSSLETKATNLETGATGLENRNSTLNTDYLAIQNRESALIVGLTGTSGVTGLEARSVGFSNKIVAINNQLNGEIQTAINTKVADSIFDALTNEFTQDFQDFQTQLNQKVVTVTQEALDARQDGDDAALEKKFCSVEEFAQTFQQTYTVVKTDNTPYTFDGKIQKVDKAPPIFSIVEKSQNGSDFDLKIKLTDYGYNVMSGNLVVKSPGGTVLHTLTKSMFNATTKLYTLSLLNSNSSGSLINGPYTFEYRASTSTAVYELVLNATVLADIPGPSGPQGDAAWGKWIGKASSDDGFGISATSDSVYVTGYSSTALELPSSVISAMGMKPGGTSLDAFVVKYNTSGVAQWARWIGGNGTDRGFGVAAAPDGVYITMTANANLYSGFPGMTSYAGTFILKYNATGTALWGKRFSSSAIMMSISVTSSDIYIAGYSDVTLGGDADNLGMGSKPGVSTYDAFILKYTISGDAVWGRWIGGAGIDYIYGISATSDAVYVTGIASDVLTVPSNIISTMGTKPGSSGNIDGFIIKYNTSGDAVWGKWIGGTGFDYIHGISATSDAVYVAGNASDVLTVPSNIISTMGSKPGGSTYDAFILKYNTSGDAIWGKWIGGAGSDSIRGISTTSDAVYVAGTASDVLTVPSNIISTMGTKPSSSGDIDGFIIKYNTSGDAVWGKWIGGAGSDSIRGISVTDTAVYVTGITDMNFIIPNQSVIGMSDKPYIWNDYVSFIVKYI